MPTYQFLYVKVFDFSEKRTRTFTILLSHCSSVVEKIDMLMEYSTSLYYLQQLSVFLGCPILISGLIGNRVCVLVFLSLRTFQNNICSFYLMCGCFMSIFKLIGGLFPRLIIIGFNSEFAMTVIYCKFLGWLSQFGSGILLTCLSLATIPHYLVTSMRPVWKRYGHLKVAYCLLGFTCHPIHASVEYRRGPLHSE